MNVATAPAPGPASAQRRPPAHLPRPNETCWCGSGDKYKRCHKDDDSVFLRQEQQWLESHRIKPGRLSAKRQVPALIARPDYAASGSPGKGSERVVRTPEEIARMRRSCEVAARVLRLVGDQVRPGATTDELDAFAHDLIVSLNCYPSPLHYRGFPKSICTSVNEVICHGIPDDRRLVEGDVVNLDITVFLDGMHGDCNATFAVGAIDTESQRLMRNTWECLMAGIAAVKPGRPVSDIGRAIEKHADTGGFGVVRTYCGHGIGDVFHGNLQIPHYYDPKASTKFEPGMTFTIEPMITAGASEEDHWSDGWTVVTKDLRRSAQYEHTVLVTPSGVEILTVEPGREPPRPPGAVQPA